MALIRNTGIKKKKMIKKQSLTFLKKKKIKTKHPQSCTCHFRRFLQDQTRLESLGRPVSLPPSLFTHRGKKCERNHGQSEDAAAGTGLTKRSPDTGAAAGHPDRRGGGRRAGRDPAGQAASKPRPSTVALRGRFLRAGADAAPDAPTPSTEAGPHAAPSARTATASVARRSTPSAPAARPRDSARRRGKLRGFVFCFFSKRK